MVGGSVRDLLLNAQDPREFPLKSDMDFDFTTNATPEQVQGVFPESFYENEFGTVSVTPEKLQAMMVEAGWKMPEMLTPEAAETTAKTINLATAGKIHISLQNSADRLSQPPQPKHLPDYQITTYRSDGEYTNHRRPETVSWGKSIEEDLSRRDFTINALAIRVAAAQLDALFSQPGTVPETNIVLSPENYTLIDLFGGLADLENLLIRPVGDPAGRFSEDALRMLRAIRFAVQLNMNMTDETFAAISALAGDIQHVSWERIRDEFLKMLASPFPAEAIELLDQTGLLHYLLPELREGQGVEQAGHHTTDVWVHSLDALRNCPSTDPIVRFATLLHDVAKPRTFKEENGHITFYNHEVIGARMAKEIAKRFRLSSADIDRMFILVRFHMFYYQPENTDSAIRRFMRNVGLANVNDILDVREADRLGSGARKTSWRLEEMKERMVQQLNQPFSINDLAIDGNDLMSEFSLKPGPQIGQILKALFEMVMETPEKNTKEELLSEAKKILEN